MLPLFMLLLLWTQINPITKSVHISNASKEQFVLPIESANGTISYVFSCYGQQSQPNQNDFVYDGDFECRLVDAGKHDSIYSTLLAEDPHQSRDWQSRARFFGTELTEPCAGIPEFGKERTFLLRGMRISLRIDNPFFSSGQELRSFDFTVSVQNSSDPLAQRSIAASPKIDPHWKESPCKLNNSVTPHFKKAD